VALHAAVAGALVVSSRMGHRSSFGALEAGGAAIGVEAVNAIPLVHHGPPNPVANDTESQAPQTPVVKPKERVKEEPPPPDAVPLKLRKSQPKPAPETSARQRFRPLSELLPNQLTSQTAPQVSNKAFSAPSGAGRIGAGPHTTLGDQFAGYADQIRRIVESKWRTDLNVQSAPVVIARFDLMRDGSIRNLELVQRSGVTALDNSVQRAIQESVFPPIPPEFTHSYASIEFTFDLKQ
jgi:TonB family protein